MGVIKYNGHTWKGMNDITIKGDITGIGVFNTETGKVEISTQRRGCIAYAIPHAMGWFNVAFLSVAKQFRDYSITFLVEKTYGNDTFFGILRIMTRIVPSGLESISLTLEYTNITDPTIFVLTHNEDSSGRIEYRLWVNNRTAWQGVIFTVLSESVGETQVTNLFTLNSPPSSDAISEIPTEYIQIPATLATIQNPVVTALNVKPPNVIRKEYTNTDGWFLEANMISGLFNIRVKSPAQNWILNTTYSASISANIINDFELQNQRLTDMSTYATAIFTNSSMIGLYSNLGAANITYNYLTNLFTIGVRTPIDLTNAVGTINEWFALTSL